MARGGHPPVVPLVMTGAGLILLLSAIKDLDPLQAAKNIATGGNPLDAKHVGSGGGDGSNDALTPGDAGIGPGFTPANGSPVAPGQSLKSLATGAAPGSRQPTTPGGA